MGGGGEQPALRKEGVGPAHVRSACTEAVAPVADAALKDCAQATAYESVYLRKDPAPAVLEVLEPPAQHRVQSLHHHVETVAAIPRRQGSDTVAKLPLARVARTFIRSVHTEGTAKGQRSLTVPLGLAAHGTTRGGFSSKRSFTIPSP